MIAPLNAPRFSLRSMMGAALLLAASAGAAAAEDVVHRSACARSVSDGAELIAIEKGYFRDAGIKVEMEDIDTSANTLALLAQNRLQIVAGGISAGYFNGIEKNLTITIIADRVSTPIGHSLMVRPDLKDKVKSLADLKGRSSPATARARCRPMRSARCWRPKASRSPTSTSRSFRLPRWALHSRNGAVDAALLIPPFTYQVREQGLGVMFIDPDDYQKPQPVSLAVNILNTEWAAKNQEAVQKYFIAYIKGVRAYCQAFHGGSTRKEIIDLLVREKIEPRKELLEEFPLAVARSEWPH